MKKLMIAACAVALAGVVQASNWNWGATSGYLYKGEGKEVADSTKITSGATAYLFACARTEVGGAYVSGAFTQDMLLSALSDSTYASVAEAFNAKGVTTAAPLSVGSNARFASSADFAFGTAETYYDFYMAIVAPTDMGDAIYLSAMVENKQASSLPTAVPIGIGSMTKGSAALPLDAGAGFKGAGWYSAVPEPTSGLLLLLGVAGLALRRRRA